MSAATVCVSFDLVASQPTEYQPEMLVTAGPNPNIPEKETDLGNNSLIFPVAGQVSTVSADLRVVKTASLPTLVSGEIQTFDIQVINAGPDPAQNVIVTDVLKNLINNSEGAIDAGYIGTTFTTPNGIDISCNSALSGSTGRSLTCDIAELPVCTQDSDCPTFTVQVRPGGSTGMRTNVSDAYSYDTADPNLGNNEGRAPYELQTKTDITVRKKATVTTGIAGQYLTYVIQAIIPDTGRSDANGVVITDMLPDGVEFISATPSGSGTCAVQPAMNTFVVDGVDN